MRQTRQRPASDCRPCLLALLLLAVTLLPGCSTFDGMFSNFKFGEDEEPKSKAPETLIVEGMDAYDVGDYSTAIKAFNTILDEHPFSAPAMLAELKAADAHYYNKQYPEAKTLYKAFEERHPTNEAMPYVLFQIGMCDFMRSDRIDRDTSGALEAIKSFTRLIQAYPQSPYSKEAKGRIKDARDFIANHEYFVADFYVRSEKYEEAQHRLKYLLAMYPDSSVSGQAKALLERLQAGKPPSTGLRKWLPEFMTKAPEDRESGEESEDSGRVPVSREEPGRAPE
jgi:outer membrane protein assembly factor BamD